MLVTTMSYHQVMPSFLDFVFSFGAQHHAEDFSFSGFRHDTRLSNVEKSPPIANLGRSGIAIQLCYNLRSVETSPEQQNWPWSIRSTATHHAFDLETGLASWLVVKGEGGISMKDRIITETGSQHANALNRFGDCSQAFSSALSTHLFLADWSVENWRWYINYMEKEVQAITRKTLSVTFARLQAEPKPQVVFTRAVNGVLVPPKRSSKWKSVTTKQEPAISMTKITQPQPNQGASGQPGPPGPPPSLPTISNNTHLDPLLLDKEFSFEDLRRIERIEEQANEALLVMTLNSSVLSSLSHHYSFVTGSADCPQVLKTACLVDLRRFKDRLSDISAETQTQKARMETLLRLLADRKALVMALLMLM
ncbi:MAG: hypothetical protein Q9195_005949 [Heterodermia aff. obscurata]